MDYIIYLPFGYLFAEVPVKYSSLDSYFAFQTKEVISHNR